MWGSSRSTPTGDFNNTYDEHGEDETKIYICVFGEKIAPNTRSARTPVIQMKIRNTKKLYENTNENYFRKGQSRRYLRIKTLFKSSLEKEKLHYM